MILRSRLPRKHIRHANLQRLPRSHHPRPCLQLLPIRRRQQIYLVLDRQHRILRRHQRISRIPASAIRNGSRHASMKIPMLLRQLPAKRHPNHRPTWLQRDQPGPQMLHQPLSLKTVPHPPLIFRIPQLKSRLVVHAPEYTSASKTVGKSVVPIWNESGCQPPTWAALCQSHHAMPENAGIDIFMIHAIL